MTIKIRIPSGVRILIIVRKVRGQVLPSNAFWEPSTGRQNGLRLRFAKMPVCALIKSDSHKVVGTLHRQHLAKLCDLKRERQVSKAIKIADFVITKEIAMEYMKKRYPGYHMRPSRWKDIKVSVYI